MTERGRPVAKIVAVDREARMDQLPREGRVTLPKPTPQLDPPTVRAQGSLSDPRHRAASIAGRRDPG